MPLGCLCRSLIAYVSLNSVKAVTLLLLTIPVLNSVLRFQIEILKQFLNKPIKVESIVFQP
jgi:hypothetical protein